MALSARIGSLIVDERAGSVTRGDGARLGISRKAVELLVVLGHAGNRPVPRDSLLQSLWPDRNVSDKALSMLVVELRRHLMPALGGRDPIRTVPGLGYCLAEPYDPCEFPCSLARESNGARGRMMVAIGAPTSLSGGSRAKSLAACFHDTLLNSLSGEPGLLVRARDVDSVDGATESSILAIRSSVRVVGRDVIFSVRCMTPVDDEICWAASERAPSSRSLDAETRLCERLRQELQFAVSGQWGRQTWKKYRQSSGFDVLAEGQRLVAERSSDALCIARGKFEHALALDPSCAPALVGMADCEILGTYYGGTEVAAATRRATAYVQRALAMNSELASAHSTHGLISLTQLRFEHAERELLEAIRLDGSSAMALQWYADLLATQGRIGEAVEAGRLAVACAPRSIVVNTQLGQLLHMAGAFEEARAQLERVLTLEPCCPGAHACLGLNHAASGGIQALKDSQLAAAHNHRAAEHSRRAVELSPGTPFYRGVLGAIFAIMGERERALRLLQALEANASRSAAFAEAAILVAGALGQTKRAIDWFRVATSNGASWALCMPMLPILSRMRAEPAFQNLIRSRGMVVSPVLA